MRQRRSRATRGLAAARASGDQDAIDKAVVKYEAAFGAMPSHEDVAPTTKTEPPAPAPVASASAPAALSPRTGTPEERILAAYQQLVNPKRRGQDIRLHDVRRLLGDDLTTSEINAAIFAMTKTGYVHISPDSSRRTLTQADHDAAIRIGSEDKHFLAIEPEYLTDPDVRAGRG